jgi:hypothetical protein
VCATRALCSLFIIAAFAGCSQGPAVKGLESSRSLGHGYWLVTVAAPVQGVFESVGHFSHCYYNNQDLGQCDRMSPSPSGKFAIYQRANTGLVMIFDAGAGQSSNVTNSFPGLLGPVNWQESDGRGQFKAGEPGSERSLTFSFKVRAGGT